MQEYVIVIGNYIQIMFSKISMDRRDNTIRHGQTKNPYNAYATFHQKSSELLFNTL